MNEEQIYFSHNELSEDDIAVLRAFEAMDDEPTQSSLSTIISTLNTPLTTQTTIQDSASEFSFEDMLLVFTSEADKDIIVLRQALQQIEQDGHMPPERFEVFRSRGHKIRGSAGFVYCHSIVGISQHIEDIARNTMLGAIRREIGLKALEYAISALEITFQELVANGEEIAVPLTILEEQLQPLPLYEAIEESEEPISQSIQSTTKITQSLSYIPDADADISAYMSIDAHRFADLLYHTEQLEELRTPLVSAQEQVEHALQELRAAQNKLAQLESKHFTLVTTSDTSLVKEDFPTSSLMARILNKAAQRNDPSHTSYKERNKFRSYAFKASEASTWDELDIAQYSEKHVVLNSLRTTISEVNAASSRVQVAFAHLDLILQEYTSQAITVHKDTLFLRLVPISNIIPRLRMALTIGATKTGLDFAVKGATTEIDQQMLEALSLPLEQLLQTCWVDTSSLHQEEPARIWLYAQEIGNDIVIELGFSVTVRVVAVDPLREVIQRLDGALSLEHNDAGGISFHMRLPHSQGTMHCLLVRTDNEQVIVPFSQIQRIGDSQREKFDKLYHLHDLINYASGATRSETSSKRIQPVLILLQHTSPFSVGVIVDEVLDEVELVVKPLPSYLQRPGLTNAAIDGKGQVLLMPDLSELIRYYTQRRYNTNNEDFGITQSISSIQRTQARILLADDSVLLRNTLVQMLKHVGYLVLEARDGVEALEQLIQHVPDVFLLDVEMPNLNGYDLLGIMRLYPSLATVKIIMLTSRSSEKHIQHAMDLGAHAYLTKPCSQELLIETIQKMLRT